MRPYQTECLDIVDSLDSGSYIIRLATGLGKTVVFTNIKRKGRVLVLAHREELVTQPVKYYDCPVGIEMADRVSDGEEVVIASVQSIVRRLDRFSPMHFDTIITDECQHSPSKTYRKIYNHFDFRLHLGFSATPNRHDNVRLDDIYEDIIYDKDLKWGIQNGYLSEIHCIRAHIAYDISTVRKQAGDYALGELETMMNQDVLNKAIAEAYQKHSKGQTLIFAVSVKHAQDIAKEIPGAVAVTADTKNRSELIEQFTRREIPVLVNCMIFTEGTDIPLVETIIIARPTQNVSLYTQMVGRGTRLCEGKDKLILIDCVGITGKHNLCTAPSLLGIDMKDVPKDAVDKIEGDLFDLPNKVEMAMDCPESWIRNIEFVDLWAKEQSFHLHGVNWFKFPNGRFVCNLLNKQRLIIEPMDELGHTVFKGKKVGMQQAFDEAFAYLRDYCYDSRYIWDLTIANAWGKAPASDKQKALIQRRIKRFDVSGLTKFEASQLINRVMHHA